MAIVLQQTLRSLCFKTGWCYAVFWKMKRRSRMVLTWEDGYCEYSNSTLSVPSFGAAPVPAPANPSLACGSTFPMGGNPLEQGLCGQNGGMEEQIGLAVAKMSYHVYSLGEGIIGRVAFTGKHQWVFSSGEKAISAAANVQGRSGGRSNNEKYPAGWTNQFSAGIKTIAVVAVPQGVVQLGSRETIMEDLNLVGHVKAMFSTLQSVPGAFLSDFVPEAPAGKVQNAYPISFQMPMVVPMPHSNTIARGPSLMHACSSQIASLQGAGGQVGKTATLQQHSLSPSSYPLNLQNSNIRHLQPDLAAQTFQMQQVGPLQNRVLPSRGSFEVKSSVTNSPATTSDAPIGSFWSANCFPPNTFQSLKQKVLSVNYGIDQERSISVTAAVEQPGVSTYDENDGQQKCLAEQQFASNYKHCYSIGSALQACKVLSRRDCSPSTEKGTGMEITRGDFVGLSSMAKPTLLMNSRLSDTKPKSKLDPVNFYPLDHSLIDTAACAKQENSSFWSVGSGDMDTQVFNHTNPGAFSISNHKPEISVGESLGVHQCGEESLDNDSRQLAAGKESCVSGESGGNDIGMFSLLKDEQLDTLESKFAIGDELSEILAPLYSRIHDKGLLDDISAASADVGSRENNSKDVCEKGLGFEHLDDLEYVCMQERSTIESKAEPLLDAIVAGITTRSESATEPNRLPTFFINKTDQTSGNRDILFGIENVNKLEPILLGKEEIREENVMGTAPNVLGDKSIKQSKYDAQSEQTLKEEFIKLGKKRKRTGELARPRPKDRQQIQDRVRELREIVPNAAKCSIDALLERTIEHMHFLQSITQNGDKGNAVEGIKDQGESGLWSGDSDASWALQFGGEGFGCPILIENLCQPRQMLVEMLCKERGFFLEIAENIRGLGLTILKGAMEVRSDKVWARFLVEASRDVQRVEVLWSLMQLFNPPSTIENQGVPRFHMQRVPYPFIAIIPPLYQGIF